MRTQHRLFLALLAVVLMCGTLLVQNESGGGLINITRPVVNTAEYEMGGSDYDSFDNWLPAKNLQDFMTQKVIHEKSQLDLSSRGASGSNNFITNQFVDSVVVAFDASHGPPFTSVDQLYSDLSMFGVELYIMWDEFIIPDGTNVLLLTGSTVGYSLDDINQIYNWFNSDGAHLIWIAGDSDFRSESDPPLFTPDSSNAILSSLGSSLRISADSVEDGSNHDGVPYRVAATQPVCDEFSLYSCVFTDGVDSAIFHGPTSVLGISDEQVVDLNVNFIPGVEVVMRASPDASALNWDGSMTDFDYYSGDGVASGNYPMMAIQDMGGDKFVIASGEATFSDYQNMYGMETVYGVWNGGFHDGKVLVDNVFTWFGVNRELSFDEPIYIFGNDDFVNYGFPGSGTSEDPFVIEGLRLTNPNDNLINIFDTDAYFVIQYNELNGFGSWVTGIQLYNVRNGVINNNIITGTGQAVYLDHSYEITVRENTFDSNGGGINLWESRNNNIDDNDITNNGWAGISVGNEQPIVWMRFWQDVIATVRDSIVWQASFVGPDEGELWDDHDNLEVVLTLDGEQVPVDIWDVYFDDGRSEFRFDMEYWAGPLPLGEHEFETHFFIAGEEYETGWFGHVTVNENIVVPIRFYEDATITEGDQIAWQSTWSNTDLATLEDVVAGVEAFLEVNGEEVEVSYSGIYFDDSRERYPDEDRYRFDANYLSDPLEVGEYVFDYVFFEFGGVSAGHAVVTVLPVSIDDNNYITNNYIANSGQGIWMDNTNTNFAVGNTIDNVWGQAISTWQSHRNTFTDNSIQFTAEGINIWGDDNVIANNGIQWNGEGIIVQAGSNNVIMYNDVFQNGGLGLHLQDVTNTYISENSIHENGWGMSIGNSEDTVVHFNTIFGNYGDGIMFQDSPRTTITENWIFDNWGAGIWGFRETSIGLYAFGDSITATDQQSIWWFADSSDWDEGYLQFEHDYLQVYLTIDEVPVEVEMSELWFDDWEGVWRYDIWYNSEPLPVGDHVFEVQFVLNEEYDEFHQPFDITFESYVNVVPGEQSLDENIITLNSIFNNGWVGIGMDNIVRGLVDSNTIENNGGQGIWIGQSMQLEITNNVLWSNWADSGINLYETSDSLVAGNEIFEHQASAILFEHSSNNVVEGNTLHDNAGGIQLGESSDNVIQFNEIFWNWGDGVNMYNSKNNLISDNSIYENGGAGIWISVDNTAYMRFWQDITATDQQNIFWQGTFFDPDFDVLLDTRDSLIVILTVDGESVEVEITDIYFDEGDGLFKFDVNFFSNPLPVGDHAFDVQFYYDEEFEGYTAIVTVIPDESGSDENWITNNYIGYNGWVGIGLDQVVGGSIDSNTIEGNGDNGVFLQGTTLVEITNNVLQFNPVLLVGSSENLISSNEVFDGFGAGIIVLYGSNSNTITYNVVHDLGDDGIGGWYSDDNILMFNEVYNVDDAILFRFSNNNFIAWNNLHDNRNRGVFLTTEPFEPVSMQFFEDITITDADSIFWQATSVADDPDYLQFEHDNMIVELTVDGEPVWVDFTDIWFDWEDGMFKYDINYFSGPLPIGDHEFNVKFTLSEGYDEDLGPFEFETTAIVTVIPNEVTSSGNFVYRNVITDNQGAGIQLIQADRNVISRNEIARSGYGGIGIIQSDENEITRNWSYENGLGGLFLDSSHNNIISWNKLYNNGLSGVFLTQSNENTIMGNTIFGNGSGGIELHDSHNNTIMFNRSTENGLSGVFLQGSSYNFIWANKLKDNVYDGVTLQANSDYNYVRSNDLEDNNGGVVVQFSTGNIITNNDIENNFYGIALDESHENTVSHNDIEKCYYGIVLRSSNGNSIEKNDVEENEYGIGLDQSHNNIIYRNTVEDNEFGINLNFSNNNEVLSNKIESNEVGIALVYSYDNIFSDNRFEGNTQDWIIIE